MSNDEKIILVVGAVLLVAVVVFRSRPLSAPTLEIQNGVPANQIIGMSLVPGQAGIGRGPRYLTYNLPWLFSQPVQMILPTVNFGGVASASGLVMPNPDKPEET